MEIFKQVTFDSAHYLPNVPIGHKCRGMHGHTYKLVLYLEGELDEQFGWVMDFAEIKNIVDPVVKSIDHRVLNDIQGLENPTCELVAQWIWNKLKPDLTLLSKIELHETPSSGVIYKGQ